MNFLDKIVEKIFDWVVAALGCVLAALGCYLFRYKRNVDNLKTQVEELRGARDRLQHDVDTDEYDVQRLLTKSDEIIAVAKKILEDDNKGWYLNMMSRYQVSMRAEKAASEAKNLKDEILKFNRVGYRESTQVGRTGILTDVLEALRQPPVVRMSCLGIIGGKIADRVLPALGRQLHYSIHYKSIVDNLTTQVEELRRARDVVNDQNNVKKIDADVQTWLNDYDRIIAEAEVILKDDRLAKMTSCNGWCRKLMSRYQGSKRAEKAALEAKNLKDEILKFPSVGYHQRRRHSKAKLHGHGYGYDTGSDMGVRKFLKNKIKAWVR